MPWHSPGPVLQSFKLPIRSFHAQQLYTTACVGRVLMQMSDHDRARGSLRQGVECGHYGLYGRQKYIILFRHP